MSNSNFILLYWKKEHEEFRKNFEILRQHADKIAVHDIRVAIKKLRACLKLYALLTKRKDPIAAGWQDLFVKTKNLFRVLGKERDVEICLELLLEYEKENKIKFTYLKTHLQSMLQTMQTWSHHALKNYREAELNDLTLSLSKGADETDKDWLIKKTIEIINEQLLQIKNYYKQPHQMRKLLKDVYYWLKMLPKDSISDTSLEKKLEKVLDDFGNWQNAEVLLSKARHFRKDSLPASFGEYDSIKTFEKKTGERKANLLKDLLHKIKRHVKEIPTPGK